MTTAIPAQPDFRSPEFLRAHIAQSMAFYQPHEIDPNGGFFHYYLDDGTVYDASHRHLVSSTRFVFNHAMAYREFGNADDLKAVEHGIRYLRVVERPGAQPEPRDRVAVEQVDRRCERHAHTLPRWRPKYSAGALHRLLR